MPPSVNSGDSVVFVNAGKLIPAVVRGVLPSGHATLEYAAAHDQPNNPGRILAHGIPFCPDGGEHGWQLTEAARAAAALNTTVPSNEDAGAATAGAASAGDGSGTVAEEAEGASA